MSLATSHIIAVSMNAWKCSGLDSRALRRKGMVDNDNDVALMTMEFLMSVRLVTKNLMMILLLLIRKTMMMMMMMMMLTMMMIKY